MRIRAGWSSSWGRGLGRTAAGRTSPAHVVGGGPARADAERPYPSFEHAEHVVLHWIGFYNGDRVHEALGDLPPAEYEISTTEEATTQRCPPPNRDSNEPRVLQIRLRRLSSTPRALPVASSPPAGDAFRHGAGLLVDESRE